MWEDLYCGRDMTRFYGALALASLFVSHLQNGFIVAQYLPLRLPLVFVEWIYGDIISTFFFEGVMMRLAAEKACDFRLFRTVSAIT